MSTRARATSMRAIRHGQQRTQLARILQWLYGAGEQGIAVPDLTPGNGFLFQDSAGTTPVTAYEQPVGLILDRSKGLVLGPELVTNGAGTSTAGWASASSFSSTLASVSGEFRVTATANFGRQIQAITCVVGTTYKITANARVVSGSNNAVVAITLSDGSGGGNPFRATTSATFDELSFYFTATATTHYICMGSGNAATGVTAFTNISVKAIPGNHLIQATSTKRPTLSARYNLLTYSEDLSNAVWLLQGVAVSATAGASPLGTTAYLVYPTSSGNNRCPYQLFSAVATSITTSVYAKASGKSWVLFNGGAGFGGTGVWFNVSTGTVGTVTAGYSGAIQSVGSGWFRLTVTHPAQNNLILQVNIVDADSSVAVVANGTDGVLMWGADCRRPIDTIGMPAYQRVGASNDYDTAGFFPYLAFDGTDDSMATAASVDFTATDKMTVFHGVTKLSDAATGIAVELSADINANNGTFYILAPDNAGAASYQFRSKGTNFAIASYTNSAVAAPISSVLTGIGGIANDASILRLNGAQVASSATDQGTGNFGSYPLYVGARNNTSFYFNGRLYPFFIRGAATDAGLIAQVEQYIRARMPVNF